MKRRSPLKSAIIFFRVPLELLYKIQSILTIASLNSLGQTCKEVHAMQSVYKGLKEKEMYTECIKRLKKHLDRVGLLSIAEKLTCQFGAVIGGDLVTEYLVYWLAYYPLIMYIKSSLCLHNIYFYIKEHVDLDEYQIFFDYPKIYIRSILIGPVIEMLIIHENKDNKPVYGREHRPHPQLHIWTDLKSVYCQDVWKLLEANEFFKTQQ